MQWLSNFDIAINLICLNPLCLELVYLHSIVVISYALHFTVFHSPAVLLHKLTRPLQIVACLLSRSFPSGLEGGWVMSLCIILVPYCLHLPLLQNTQNLKPLLAKVTWLAFQWHMQTETPYVTLRLAPRTRACRRRRGHVRLITSLSFNSWKNKQYLHFRLLLD